MTALESALPYLLDHRRRLMGRSMRQLFEDPNRFRHFSVEAGDIFLDYSKNKVDREVMAALVDLADRSGVSERRTAMLAGDPINSTEHRAVMHVALRAGQDAEFPVGGEAIMPGIRTEREHMARFAEKVRSGEIAGTGGPFTDVINIGIGGSDLGPAMVTRALHPYHDGPRTHFVSNVDGAHIADTISGLDPTRTLVLVASKTFTTVETMTNARTAREWMAGAVGEDGIGKHFAAMSTAAEKMAEFGIAEDRRFGFGDWVGGRYSLWSVIGLPIAIAIGPDNFDALLAGARTMDEHFEEAPLSANLPVILALIGVWHRNVCGYPALAVLPYDERLQRLPAYLQQLDMESNGKRTNLDGERVSLASEALMWGKTEAEARDELAAAGLSTARINALAPHKTFPGERPTNTILYPKLTPAVLGQLIALYEHKVFVQGTIWNVNSFDQWGVELGKQLASGFVPEVRDGTANAGSGSTRGLLAAISNLRKSPKT